MRLIDLPSEVGEDLCQEDRWRLDIDPGLDAKHEFFLSWRNFVTLPEKSSPYYESTEADLADFLTFDGSTVRTVLNRQRQSEGFSLLAEVKC